MLPQPVSYLPYLNWGGRGGLPVGGALLPHYRMRRKTQLFIRLVVSVYIVIAVFVFDLLPTPCFIYHKEKKGFGSCNTIWNKVFG